MKISVIIATIIFLCGCYSSVGPERKNTTQPPYENSFEEKIYIETHNNETHCLVRVWIPAKTEEVPLVVFRGTPGKDTCKIYTITNPDYTLEENDDKR